METSLTSYLSSPDGGQPLTLKDLRRMLIVSNLEEKFRIIFIAQTGMRVTDAVRLKIRNIEDGLYLEEEPLTVRYLPRRGNKTMGERVTFLAKDGIEIMRLYFRWRTQSGENLTRGSPLFVSRIGKNERSITPRRFIDTFERAAMRAGLTNVKRKVGARFLRSFFIFQLKKCGFDDGAINFITGRKVSRKEWKYWSRRVKELREMYRENERYLNPLTVEVSALEW